MSDSEIENVIHSRINQLNARLEEYERIRKFIVVKADFQADIRCVTVFQKNRINRKAVDELYAKEIVQIYSQPLGEVSA